MPCASLAPGRHSGSVGGGPHAPTPSGKTDRPLKSLDTTVTKASAWAQQQRKPAAVRELLGLTGQFAAVDELLTGRENLEMFGRLFKLSSEEARRRAGELLARFGLAQAADRPARTYSGGMRRRLDIASSLLHHAGLAADVREISPVTVTADAARSLALLGTPASLGAAAAWIGGLLAVFIPLSVWRYRRMS